MGWLENYIKGQLAEHTSVTPISVWSDKDRCFYINSIAGLIKYKPKDLKDLTRFRNTWINKFDLIAKDPSEKKLFKLYDEILGAEKVSYKANLRTRLKGLKWTLKV